MSQGKDPRPGGDFVGRWKVVNEENKYMIIERGDKNKEFKLYEEVHDGRQYRQTLRYVPRTKTLENLDPGSSKKPPRERCIAFWDRKRRNSAVRNSIFAKRIRQQDGEELEGELLSWEHGEKDGGTGTWGAEEGGGG